MRRCYWTDLFDGGCTFRVTHQPLPTEESTDISHHTRAAMLARDWFVRRNGSLNIVVEHGVGPRGIRKHWMQALEAVEPSAFQEASMERFLTTESRTQSIVSHLYTLWCMAEGRCKTRSDDNLTIPTGNEGMHWLLDLAICQPHRWLTVRIEDTVDDRRKVQGMQQLLERTLLRRFHQMSSFEFDSYEAAKRAWS